MSSMKSTRPSWLRVRSSQSAGFEETTALMRLYGLSTVCEEAACPNIGECWNKKHATIYDIRFCLYSWRVLFAI